MELIYSTNDLSEAQRLSSALTRAGLLNSVSGANSAQLAGYLASAVPSSIGVWLASASELPRAREIMLATGFVIDTPARSESAAWYSSAWVKLAVALAVTVIVALVAYAP